MIRSMLIQVLLIIVILFFGCDNSSETETEIADSQILFFYGYYSDSYWDRGTEEIVEQENTSGGGVLFSNPMANFESFKMGTESFIGDDYFEYLPGYIIFGNISFDVETRIPKIDPLDVEVKTSIGILTGSVNIPDSVETITLSVNDTLALGDPFTITWTSGNADFYTIYSEYFWIDDSGNIQNEDLTEFVSGNSITYPGSKFLHDGEISFIYIDPINGPIPEVGTEGNMSGDGDGFLYYNISGSSYEGESIVVGSGNTNLPKKALRSISEKDLLKKNKELLERRIRESR